MKNSRLQKLIAESILAEYLGYSEMAKELRQRAREIEKSLKSE